MGGQQRDRLDRLFIFRDEFKAKGSARGLARARDGRGRTGASRRPSAARAKRWRSVFEHCASTLITLLEESNGVVRGTVVTISQIIYNSVRRTAALN